MTKHIFIALLIGIVKTGFSQSLFQGLIQIRFLNQYEAHYVGKISENIVSSQPAFDPLPINYNRDSIMSIIEKELDKYPRDVLELAKLKEIVICDGVYFNDENNEPTRRFSGTYLYWEEPWNVIFLDGMWAGLPGTLHHEFSSVLFSKLFDTDSLFRKKYIEVESYFKKSTNYIEDSPNWIDDQKYQFPKNSDNRVVLRNDGYALTSFENDYNSIAASLFAPKNMQLLGLQLVDNQNNLWDFLNEADKKQYPIYDKVIKIIALYNHINPVFTISYFQDIEAQRH